MYDDKRQGGGSARILLRKRAPFFRRARARAQPRGSDPGGSGDASLEGLRRRHCIDSIKSRTNMHGGIRTPRGPKATGGTIQKPTSTHGNPRPFKCLSHASRKNSAHLLPGPIPSPATHTRVHWVRAHAPFTSLGYSTQASRVKHASKSGSAVQRTNAKCDAATRTRERTRIDYPTRISVCKRERPAPNTQQRVHQVASNHKRHKFRCVSRFSSELRGGS